MTNFDVTILGCGSATPTVIHHPSAQLLNANEKLMLIDCGEGTQLQMRKAKCNFSKLHSIFISHLHGDHIYGLPGLLSTLSLLGRTADLTIYAHPELEQLLLPILSHKGNHLTFKVLFSPLQQADKQLIFENNTFRIYSFPLKHRLPTNGFLFVEKEQPRHLIREMIDFYDVPISQRNLIKTGADFITPDGTVVPNDRLTKPAAPPRSYAYCSDTIYNPRIIPYIKGCDVLYHEATFEETELKRATETMHSTARQAAQIALEAEVGKLVIGHFSSRYYKHHNLLKEAQEVFANTELADEGKQIVL